MTDSVLQQLADTLTEIHHRPHQLVLEFTGAGSQSLTWLHSVGGSSRTIIEATDRYGWASLESVLGYQPEQATSAAVVADLAKRAFDRAKALASNELPVVGIGCSATVATDRAKRGDHRCYVAAHNPLGTVIYGLTMNKGVRTRQEEENLVSQIILKAIADVFAVTTLPDLSLLSEETLVLDFKPTSDLAKLADASVDAIEIQEDGTIDANQDKANLLILSGSFNPLHEGHRQLASIASDLLCKPTHFEIPLINAEKAPIDLQEAHKRAAQFGGYAPLLFTRCPLFTQKAQVFPQSTFILGADTAERLVQPRFYNDDQAEMFAALDILADRECRFLVAGRVTKGRFMTLANIVLPDTYRHLFSEIPPDRFRMDISSTELRQRSSQT